MTLRWTPAPWNSDGPDLPPSWRYLLLSGLSNLSLLPLFWWNAHLPQGSSESPPIHLHLSSSMSCGSPTLGLGPHPFQHQLWHPSISLLTLTVWDSHLPTLLLTSLCLWWVHTPINHIFTKLKPTNVGLLGLKTFFKKPLFHVGLIKISLFGPTMCLKIFLPRNLCVWSWRDGLVVKRSCCSSSTWWFPTVHNPAEDIPCPLLALGIHMIYT